MFGARFSLMPLVTAHYRAFLTAGERRLSLSTISAVFIVPAIVGVAAALFAVGAGAYSPMIAGLGVLAGGFLSGFVLLTNLRMKVHENQAYRARLSRLIGETAATALYLMACCLAVVLLVITAFAFGPSLHSYPWARQLFNGFLFFALAHVAMTALTFMRRVFAVYYELFRADFAPKLEQVAEKPNPRRSA